ncbi:MAG TPA: cupredoxin domain-containing protein [Candidatus Saccharimonadales bacterium]|nr:cupredoxin domain-containing protein [Candidatus Saccharimonadales bacterium]
MNKTMKLVVALVVVIIVVVSGVLLFGKKKTNAPSTNNSSASNSSQTNSSTSTITYDGNQFEPQTLTIKAGSKVKIVNQSSDSPLSFDSDPHPTHTDEPELNAGSIDPGVSTQITVTKVGNWGYHNHLHPEQTGRIVVTN